MEKVPQYAKSESVSVQTIVKLCQHSGVVGKDMVVQFLKKPCFVSGNFYIRKWAIQFLYLSQICFLLDESCGLYKKSRPSKKCL